MVVLFHAGLPVPGGFVGVDVFFVISGFVITAMLMREHDQVGRIRLWRFYVRRFKRLTPALAVTVSFVMLASLVLLSPLGGGQQAAAKTGLGAMFLAANVMIARTTGGYFDSPADFNPLLNTWSLSVEEQFYLAFPAVMVIGWLIARRTDHARIILAAAVGAMGVVSFALAMAGAANVQVPFMPDSLIGFYGPATRAWEFAVGALLALGGSRLAATTPRTALALGAAGAAMVASSLWLISSETKFPGPWTLLPVVGSVLLLVSGTADSPIRRVLGSGTMVAIGDRSYSIYLWHWPFIVFARLIWSPSPWVLTVAALASLVPAFVSYRWIEQPIRALPTERGLPLLRLVAVMVVPPVALAVALGISAKNNLWNPTFKIYAEAVNAPHLGNASGCDVVGWPESQRCIWNEDSLGKRIYLVGDSNADQLSEGLLEAAESLSRPLVNLTASGCSYVASTTPSRSDDSSARCQDFVRRTTDVLEAADPGLVVLANSYPYRVLDDTSHPSSTNDLRSRQSRLDDFRQDLQATVRILQDTGHTVLLVQTIPQWGSAQALSWQQCNVVGLRVDGCIKTIPLAVVEERQAPVADIVSAVAVATHSVLLDVNDQICPSSVCANIRRDGLLTYRDGTHITVGQSRELAPALSAAIETTDP